MSSRAYDLPPVLVFGGGITLLGALRCLGRARIRALVASPVDGYIRASRWYHALRTPFSESPDPDRLAEALGRLPLPRAVLLPCSDTWSLAMASLGDRLSRKFPRSLSPAPVQEILTDKGRFAAALDRSNVPHPTTTDVASRADLEALPAERFQGSFLKPRASQAFSVRYGVKAFRCGSKAEAIERFEAVHRDGLELVFQEYIPGPPTAHVFVDGFVDRNGRVTARFARRRLRMFPPDFGNSTYMVSVPLSEVAPAVDSVERLLLDLGFRGIFSAEFKHDERDGLFKILEVNARPWWYVGFAADCGVNVCEAAYHDALGRDGPPVGDYDVGRTCVFPQYDWVSCVGLHREGRLSLRDWASSWVKGKQPVFRWDDPLPAFRNFGVVFPKAVRRAVHRAPTPRNGPAPGRPAGTATPGRPRA